MSRRALAWVLAAAVVLPTAAVALRPAKGEAVQSVRVASGYVDIVNAVFIPQRWLRWSEKGRVELTPSARAFPQTRTFFDASFLREDAKQRSLWRIDNGIVSELFAWSHNQPLPFQRNAAWTGDLNFRRYEQLATLSSAQGDVRLSARQSRADQRRAVDLLTRRFSGEGAIVDLHFGAEHAATVQRLGPVILVRAAGRAVEVTIDGVAVPPSEHGILRPGAQLSLSMGTRRVSFASYGLSAPGVSVAQPLTVRYRAPEMEGFAEPFERAMNEAVRRGFPARESLASSLDYQLHKDLQRQLTSFARGAGRFNAAATVIDAQTGEVLALASYPSGGVEQPTPGAPPARNLNFTLMPMGSAAKVPVTAAILAERPDLVDLKVEGGGAVIEDVLGLKLEQPLNEEAAAPGAMLSLEDFIKRSSNRYAAALMLLAGTNRPDEVSWQGPGAQYVVGGAQRTGLPPLAFSTHVGSDGRWTIADQREKLAWPGRLNDLFDIEYERVVGISAPNPYGDDLSDMGPWRDLITHETLAKRRPPLLAGLRDISPQTVNFATNRTGSFRRDYVQMIIGGQAYGWTPLKLAESYARIVTGRRVETTLLQRGRPENWEPLRPYLREDVRRRLVGALRGPVAPGGTAAQLGPIEAELSRIAAARGERVVIFAKTGSPRLERPIKSRLEQAEDRLIRANLLVYERPFVSVQTAKGRFVVEGGAGGAQARKALEADPVGSQIIQSSGYSARALIDRAVRFNNDPQQNLYRIRNDLLIEVLQGGSVVGSDVKAVALVVARYPMGASPGDPPIRALAMVVNIQRQWLEGNEAVVFTRCVLPASIAPVLFEDRSVRRVPTAECSRLGIS